jgi:hypothetical protein
MAQLGYDTSPHQHATPEQIHSILDRHRAAASPFRVRLCCRRGIAMCLRSSAWASDTSICLL